MQPTLLIVLVCAVTVLAVVAAVRLFGRRVAQRLGLRAVEEPELRGLAEDGQVRFRNWF